MARGTNTCAWLMLGTTNLCGRSCLGTHCKIHLLRLRKGPPLQPCGKCGKGVRSSFGLCRGCGAGYIILKRVRKKKKAFADELRRLAAIDIEGIFI